MLISMSRSQAAGELTVDTTVVAVCLTTLVNMGTKGAIGRITGHAAFGRPLIRGYAAGMAAGGLATAWVALTD